MALYKDGLQQQCRYFIAGRKDDILKITLKKVILVSRGHNPFWHRQKWLEELEMGWEENGRSRAGQVVSVGCLKEDLLDVLDFVLLSFSVLVVRDKSFPILL